MADTFLLSGISPLATNPTWISVTAPVGISTQVGGTLLTDDDIPETLTLLSGAGGTWLYVNRESPGDFGVGGLPEHLPGTGLTYTAPTPGVIPTGDTGTIPLFVGNVDPNDDPDTAALVVAGALWKDTTFGPPYALKEWDAVNSVWSPAGMTVYNVDGQAIVTIAASIPTPLAQMMVLDAATGIISQVSIGTDQIAISRTDGPTVLAIGLSGDGLQVAGLPSADPSVPGSLYTDGAPSAGVPKPLMLSGGPA